MFRPTSMPGEIRRDEPLGAPEEPTVRLIKVMLEGQVRLLDRFGRRPNGLGRHQDC